ncbi:uncharacterized protein LOC131664486 [Phymastichus coffea]|uniref:uncharacterized protein LOC131664486 n=1 Tax=Phymastichus coffea TaxID=108790 RepID=UPI00273BD168|nr:uncharacterized protein LOC131664486 [Phymastichus coffea]
MKLLLVGLLSLLGSSSAAPPLASYDQRQEGDLNVKVDLDNFVIVLARPSSSSSGFDLLGSVASLLADTKSNRVPVHAEADSEANAAADANGSKGLDDVSLGERPAKSAGDEAVVVLIQSHADGESKSDEATRDVGQVARTLRNLRPREAASHAAEKSKSFLSSKYKFVDSVHDPQSLKLIGDAIEACGPGRSRDRFGVCKQD